jgi:hypothetical protein
MTTPNKTSARWMLQQPEWRVNADYETIRRESACQFYDDFEGPDIVIPAAGAAESGCKWVKKIVGAAPPTVAGVANTANGIIACALTAADQKQDAALYWDDQLTLPLNSAAVSGAVGVGLIFEARIRLAVLPTTETAVTARAIWGLAGAWADNAVSANRIIFSCEGAGDGLIKVSTDDSTTDSGLITTATNVTAAQWATYRIDATDVTDIKFYIDNTRVASGTTFTMIGAPTASVVLQPYVSVMKTNKAGVATLYVDYVRVWHDRE